MSLKREISQCFGVLVAGVLMYGLAFAVLAAYFVFLIAVLIVPATFSEKIANYFEQGVNYTTRQVCYLIDGKPPIVLTEKK